MNNALSGIERDIILSYLCTEPVGFTLVPEQPAEQIFSFAIGSSGIKMLPEGILLFTDPLIFPVELYGKQVEIRFYFKKLGLSFTSVIRKVKNGACGAIVIPREIIRLPDASVPSTSPFGCTVFLGESFKGDKITCRFLDQYPLFVPATWKLLPETVTDRLAGELRRLCHARPATVSDEVIKLLVKSGKGLMVKNGTVPEKDPFPFTACLTAGEIAAVPGVGEAVSHLKSGFYFVTGGHYSVSGQVFFVPDSVSFSEVMLMLPYIPICRFLAEPSFHTPPAVLGRIEPISLLYISFKEIILATAAPDFPLQKDIPYSVLLQIPLKSLRRSITLNCTPVTFFYNEQKDRVCVRCRLSGMKVEDARFLYESFNGTPCV